MLNIDEKIKLFFQYQILIDFVQKYKLLQIGWNFCNAAIQGREYMFNVKGNQIKISMPRLSFMQ